MAPPEERDSADDHDPGDGAEPPEQGSRRRGRADADNVDIESPRRKRRRTTRDVASPASSTLEDVESCSAPVEDAAYHTDPYAELEGTALSVRNPVDLFE